MGAFAECQALVSSTTFTKRGFDHETDQHTRGDRGAVLPRHYRRSRARQLSDHGPDRAKGRAEIPDLVCEQLAAQRAQRSAGTQSPMEQRAVQMLRQNPQMRQAFLNRVAGPIANRLFECGMIP